MDGNWSEKSFSRGHLPYGPTAIWYSTLNIIIRPPKEFVVSVRVASDRASAFLIFFFCYETMSNCSQNCWIDWNSAVHWALNVFFTSRGMNVWPICEAAYLVPEIWSPHMQYVSRISLLVPPPPPPKKACHHTDFEADRWPETGYFLGGGLRRGGKLKWLCHNLWNNQGSTTKWRWAWSDTCSSFRQQYQWLLGIQKLASPLPSPSRTLHLGYSLCCIPQTDSKVTYTVHVEAMHPGWLISVLEMYMYMYLTRGQNYMQLDFYGSPQNYM